METEAKIPTNKVERTAYALEVMLQANWKNGKCDNVEAAFLNDTVYSPAHAPAWNWATHDYRIIPPEVEPESEIPTDEFERAKYASEVMAQAEWKDGKCRNLEVDTRGRTNFGPCTSPSWNWDAFDYRIATPVQLRYVNVYAGYKFGAPNPSVVDCIKAALSRALIDRLRITGGGDGAKYESIGLDAKE